MAATAWLRMARSVGQLPRAHLNKLESGTPSEGGIKIKPSGRTEAREGEEDEEEEDRKRGMISFVSFPKCNVGGWLGGWVLLSRTAHSLQFSPSDKKSEPPQPDRVSGRVCATSFRVCRDSRARRGAEINLVGTKELFPISEKVSQGPPSFMRSCRPSVWARTAPMDSDDGGSGVGGSSRRHLTVDSSVIPVVYTK